MYHGTNLLLIRLDFAQCLPLYFNFFCKHLRSKGIFSINAQHAVNQASLNQKKIKTFNILLPPLPEQQKIVEIIEELFSELDKGVESLKKAKEQLKVYRQAVLKNAFEGKLTEKWREQNIDKLEPPEALLEKIRKEREEAARKQGKKLKSVKSITEQELASLPELPKEWAWVKVQTISDIIGGVTKGRKLEGKETIKLPYLRVANVQDGYLDLDEIKFIEVLPTDLPKYKLVKDDVLYIEGGDKDKLGRGTLWNGQIENCIHQNHVFRARLISKQISPKFIAYFSQTKAAKKYFFAKAKQTVNLASINLTVLSNLPITFPPVEEQLQIVQEIESRLSVCDEMEKTVEESLKKAEKLRQSILKKAFEGELTEKWRQENPELISGENSAEALLKKIKAEKR